MTDIPQILYPVFDRAHGKNVLGKASPAFLVPHKFADDDDLVFREFEFSENMIDRIEAKWQALGYKSSRTVPNDDPFEPGLMTRYRRINAMKVPGQLLTFSVHANARKMGDTWEKSRGMAYFTSVGHTLSDEMCKRLYKFSEARFPDVYHFKKDIRAVYPGLEANFTVLMAKGAAILAEIGFQDNRDDVRMLLSESFRDQYSTMAVEWLVAENILLNQIHQSNARQ